MTIERKPAEIKLKPAEIKFIYRRLYRTDIQR